MKALINERLWERPRGSFLAVVLLGALAHPFLACPAESETNRTQTNTTQAASATAGTIEEFPALASTTTNSTQAASATAGQSESEKLRNANVVRELRQRADKGDSHAQEALGSAFLYGSLGVTTNMTKAVKWYRKAAEQGSALAQSNLGVCYANGQGVAKDAVEAVKWYRKAAEQNDVVAQFNLGFCYTSGEGVAKDYGEAVKWLTRAAVGGNIQAQLELANIYQYGDGGVATNMTEVVKWLTKAAEGGLSSAQLELAEDYEFGRGVATNMNEAVKWYRKAAEQNYGEAQTGLGLLYYEGRGVSQDYGEALKWWRKAAEQGHPYAQFCLARAYEQGFGGLSVDLAEAVKWLRKAADKGFQKAQVRLGEMFVKSKPGISFEEAERWFRMAAEHGSVTAQRGLGIMYGDRGYRALDEVKMQLRAEGVKNAEIVPEKNIQDLAWAKLPREAVQDFKEAAKWYQKAAERGDPSAQCFLGALNRDGMGVSRDLREAVKWFRRSANQGDWIAQYNLGHCYERGEGVPQDFIEAYKWYNLDSAASGTGETRDRLAEKMTPNQIAEAQRRSSLFTPRTESSEKGETQRQDEPLSEDQNVIASGSGFFVTDDGYFVTAYHVIEDANRIGVRTKTGAFPARLVSADKANDLAVLKAVGKFSCLAIAPSRGVRLGETVLTVGFPNTGLQGFAPKLTKGEISSLTGAQDDPRYFQISVAVQPGNSGGPLVNQYGSVIGIVEARLSDMATFKATGSLPQNVNYAVKSSLLSVLLESLPEVSAKLKEPSPVKDRKFEDLVKETESATALVMVY